MNYLRGAVSAISAPYQYYKDINPSTLTGAIDVIVIQRPAANGGTELVCSPFHVRFGKWQVLRPSEKMVQVLVNGHSIPFDMKIGEAGEAFFVFETEDDVPDSLITSPIIHPTDPVDTFEGKGATNEADADGQAPEPDYLDLDAQDQQTDTTASGTKRRPDKLDLSEGTYPSTPPAYPTPRSNGKSGPEQRADAMFRSNSQLPTPEVEYKHDIALDAEGYHSRQRARDASEDTILGSEPSRASTSSSAGSTPQPSRSPSPEPSDPSSSKPLTSFRALSEPPPDSPSSSRKAGLSLPMVLTPVQEYSWEWGSFPQPSPVVPTFNKDQLGTWGYSDKKRGRPGLNRAGSEDKGKARLLMSSPVAEEDEDYFNQEGSPPDPVHRSHSVPPELDGSPTQQRKALPPDHSTIHFPTSNGDSADTQHVGFGAGGSVSPSRSDPKKLIALLEGKKIEFELCLVPGYGEALESALDVFNGRDELAAAEAFDNGRVDYYNFLEDDTVVHEPGLVIRWVGDAYIVRRDQSPLMDALVLWRRATLEQKSAGAHTRPVSPTSDNELLSEDEDEDDREEGTTERKTHNRAKSLPARVLNEQSAQPSSSTWSQWWSRSKKQSQHSEGASRPDLRVTASEPVEVPTHERSSAVEASSSTSGNNHVVDESPAPPGKKFAKTLRLTSDQLKALNLKMGLNSITFSLSATGAVACTASIFVWDHTEHVVVSDIDGTITKSDALGHVLTMIGRDWTHLGVAKLYTDIVKNGYKIMYLTSRAIGQADSTRDYLKGIKQDHYQLPEGPVIMSPDRLMASLHREVIMRKPELFKMACLRDIQRLFGEASRNPFYAGFGNRITDALSYRSVDVPSARIFTIDSTGEVKMELLELAGYKSSYIHMTDLVDQMFPPIHRKVAPEFTDFNYWKAPVADYPLPDLTPPSPALSARSETSNRSALNRIRNFSLVTNSRKDTMKATKAVQDAQRSDDEREGRSAELRQMSSFERLSNTLSNFTRASSPDSSRRSASPESNFSYNDDDEDGWDASGNRRERRKSVSSMSMPGSLNDDDMQFDFEDDDEEDNGEHRGEMYHEEADEEAFDEDIELAGEMKNVPFM